MKRFFSATWLFLRSLPWRSILREVRDVAIPLVETLAALTPTRTDDELIAAAKKYHVDQIIHPDLSWHDRGLILKAIAVEALQKSFPSVPVSLIADAVQSAYEQFKAKKETA